MQHDNLRVKMEIGKGEGITMRNLGAQGQPCVRGDRICTWKQEYFKAVCNGLGGGFVD